MYRFGHAGDVSFDVDVSWAWPERVRKTTFIGTQGQIVWNQDVNTYTIYRNKIVNNRAVIDTEPEVIQYCHDMTPLECEIKHWIDCVKNRTLPTTGVKQALEVAKLIDQFSI